MKNKTINLNNKIWYRFLKVVFVLTFIVVEIMSLVFLGFYEKVLDQEATYINIGKTLKESYPEGQYFLKHYKDYTDYDLGELARKNYNPIPCNQISGRAFKKACEQFTEQIDQRSGNVFNLYIYKTKIRLKEGFTSLVINIVIFWLIYKTFIYIICGKSIIKIKN